jgi:hypothetical protein
MGRYDDHSLPRRYRLIKMPLSMDIHEFADFIVICCPQPQEIEVIGRRGCEDTDRGAMAVKQARVRGTMLKVPKHLTPSPVTGQVGEQADTAANGVAKSRRDNGYQDRPES